MDWTLKSRDECKDITLSLLNGGDNNEIFNSYGVQIPESCEWIEKFKKQIQEIHKSLSNNSDFLENKKITLKKYNNNPKIFNFDGKVVNNILCLYENILVQHIINYCNTNNVNVISNCFDGCIIKPFDHIDNFLEKLMTYVNEKTGFVLKIKEKEMNEYISLDGLYTNKEKKEIEKEKKKEITEENKKKLQEEKEIEKQKKKEITEENKKKLQEEKENKKYEQKLKKKQDDERVKFEKRTFEEKISDSVMAQEFIKKIDGRIFFDKTTDSLYIYNEKNCLFELINSKFVIKTMIPDIIDEILDNMEYNNAIEMELIVERKNELKNDKEQNLLLNQIIIRLEDSSEFILEKFNKMNFFPFDDKVVDFSKSPDDEFFIRKRVKDDYFTFTTKNEYIDDFDKDWCDKYLSEILNTQNKVYIDKFLTLISHLLTPDNSLKLLIFLYGDTGNNGKSLFCNCLKKIFSDFCCHDASKAILERRGNSCLDTEKYILYGKRSATMSELKKTDKLDLTFVKRVTGDDGDVSMRVKADSLQKNYKINCKFIIPCDTLPDLPTDNNPLDNRLCFISFNNVFSKNPEKMKEVESMTNHLFSYLCHKASELTQSKYNFEMCDEMTNFTNDTKKSIITCVEFIDEYYELTDNINDKIKFSDLYDEYCNWCRDKDIKPMIKDAFGKKMLKEPYLFIDDKTNTSRKKNMKEGGKAHVFYRFIKKKSYSSLEEEDPYQRLLNED
jgi:flagellar motor protein MotB